MSPAERDPQTSGPIPRFSHLEEKESLFRSLLERFPYAVVIVNRDGQLVFINE